MNISWKTVVGRASRAFRRIGDAVTAPRFEPGRWERQRQELERSLAQPTRPRIALVKQDVCEDLYCCPPGSDPRTLVESTMLRTGPVALLTKCGAEFLILKTLDEPECSLWKERANDLHWDTLEFFSSYRDRIPGRDYGQSRFAVDPGAVDWSKFDIVISIDIAIPSRITRQFPKTSWCYYVREIKAPSYSRSLTAPLPGQDLVFSHHFSPARQTGLAPHVLDIPYHLQCTGWFHEMFGGSIDDARHGVFVDHHTAVRLSAVDVGRFQNFGPFAAPIAEPQTAVERGQTLPHRRTVDPDLRQRLMTSRYFVITPGQRPVFGTALVEAIAAGCLAIGSPNSVGGGKFLFTPLTAADSVTDAIHQIERFEAAPELYSTEVSRQRALVNWLCYTRPLNDILQHHELIQRHM